MKFPQELADDSPFRAQYVLAGKDVVTLATDILLLDQEAFSPASRRSLVKRANLAGLKRIDAIARENASWGQNP